MHFQRHHGGLIRVETVIATMVLCNRFGLGASRVANPTRADASGATTRTREVCTRLLPIIMKGFLSGHHNHFAERPVMMYIPLIRVVRTNFKWAPQKMLCFREYRVRIICDNHR